MSNNRTFFAIQSVINIGAQVVPSTPITKTFATNYTTTRTRSQNQEVIDLGIL